MTKPIQFNKFSAEVSHHADGGDDAGDSFLVHIVKDESVKDETVFPVFYFDNHEDAETLKRSLNQFLAELAFVF